MGGGGGGGGGRGSLRIFGTTIATGIFARAGLNENSVLSAFDYARASIHEFIHESIRAIHITRCEQGEWIPNRFQGS